MRPPSIESVPVSSLLGCAFEDHRPKTGVCLRILFQMQAYREPSAPFRSLLFLHIEVPTGSFKEVERLGLC